MEKRKLDTEIKNGRMYIKPPVQKEATEKVLPTEGQKQPVSDKVREKEKLQEIYASFTEVNFTLMDICKKSDSTEKTKKLPKREKGIPNVKDNIGRIHKNEDRRVPLNVVGEDKINLSDEMEQEDWEYPGDHDSLWEDEKENEEFAKLLVHEMGDNKTFKNVEKKFKRIHQLQDMKTLATLLLPDLGKIGFSGLVKFGLTKLVWGRLRSWALSRIRNFRRLKDLKKARRVLRRKALKAAKNAAEKKARVIAKHEIKRATEKAIKELGKEATEEAIERAIYKNLEEAAEKGVRESIEKAARGSIQKEGKRLGKKFTKEMSEKLTKEILEDVLKPQFIKNAISPVIEKASKAAARRVMARLAKEATKKAAKKLGEKTAREGIEAGIKKATRKSIIKVLGELGEQVIKNPKLATHFIKITKTAFEGGKVATTAMLFPLVKLIEDFAFSTFMPRISEASKENAKEDLEEIDKEIEDLLTGYEFKNPAEESRFIQNAYKLYIYERAKTYYENQNSFGKLIKAKWDNIWKAKEKNELPKDFFENPLDWLLKTYFEDRITWEVEQLTTLRLLSEIGRFGEKGINSEYSVLQLNWNDFVKNNGNIGGIEGRLIGDEIKEAKRVKDEIEAYKKNSKSDAPSEVMGDIEVQDSFKKDELEAVENEAEFAGSDPLLSYLPTLDNVVGPISHVRHEELPSVTSTVLSLVQPNISTEEQSVLVGSNSGILQSVSPAQPPAVVTGSESKIVVDVENLIKKEAEIKRKPAQPRGPKVINLEGKPQHSIVSKKVVIPRNDIRRMAKYLG